MKECKYCKHKNFIIKENSIHKGLYCADCGKFQKWVSQEEVIEIENKIKTNINIIKELTAGEMARFLYNSKCSYCIYEVTNCEFKDCRNGIELWLESEFINETFNNIKS